MGFSGSKLFHDERGYLKQATACLRTRTGIQMHHRGLRRRRCDHAPGDDAAAEEEAVAKGSLPVVQTKASSAAAAAAKCR